MYWHMLPTATQGRKVIWNGVDRYGRKVIDQAVPKAIRKRTNDQEMFIELVNGSIIQIVGSDNYDSLVGANPIGVVFSEYAIANPMAWSYIRPMLVENKGWAIFISTPRGRNHFHRLYTVNQEAPDWFCELRDITTTVREDGTTPIIRDDELDEERREGKSEDLLMQEYYCSWEGGLEGAYYTQEVADIRKNRFGHYPLPPGSPMLTAWDIGIRDKTAIGVFAKHPQTGHPVLMDAYEDRNKGLAHYIAKVHKWRDSDDFLFNWHFGPHDLHKTEFTNNTRIVDRAADMGINFEVLPRSDVTEGIDLCRAFLKVLHVNRTPATEHVLDMLGAYRQEYDDKKQVFNPRPLHDFTSDTADMMRYAAQAWDPSLLAEPWARRSFKVKGAIRRGN